MEGQVAYKRKIVLVVFCLKFLIIHGRLLNTVIFKDDTLYENFTCLTTAGKSGICIEVWNCPSESMHYTLEEICSFNKTTPLVCCSESNPTANQIKDDLMVAPAEIECETHHPYKQLEMNNKNTKTFVDGWAALPGDYPHMAALGWSSGNTYIEWNCGGTLISESYVMTAAHCVVLNDKPDIVRVGGVDLDKSPRTLDTVDFDIIEFIPHPDYKSHEVYNDIALLKIKQKSKENFSIKPACLWLKEELPQSEFIAMGYGTSSFAGPRTNQLFQGNLTLTDFEYCKNDYGTSKKYPNGLISSQLCVHDPNGKMDTCQGDSGGPLEYTQPFTRDRNNVPYIVGITSFGKACASQSSGVYTRLFPFLNWIESIVWTH